MNELQVSSSLTKTFDSTFYDTLKYKAFCYDLKLTNESDSNKVFWIMSCSWWENWSINYDSLIISSGSCDGNYPVLEKVVTGQTKYFKATIVDYSSSGFKYINKIKFGFLYCDSANYSINEYLEALKRESTVRIVWQN